MTDVLRPPVFLIGYMASGKTTFGRPLAEALSFDFIDLDDYIEEKYGTSISRLFALRGEEGFRIIEREALHEVAGLKNSVIACGGGTPCFFDNIDFMNLSGTTVWLNASEEVLLRRLIEENDKRPLMAGKSADEILHTIRRQLSSRSSFYGNARIVWNSDRLESDEEIAAAVNSFLKVHSNH